MQERVAGHEGQASCLGKTCELETVGTRGRKRLLDEGVLAMSKGIACQGVVRFGGGSDDDGIDTWVGEKFGSGVVEGEGGVPAAECVEACRVRVCDGGQRRPGQVGKVSNEVGAPVARADDANARRGGAWILHRVVTETVGMAET